MTSDEYEKQKADIDNECALKKGKLAEAYLKERGILDQNGRPHMYTSFSDWPLTELYRLSEKLHTMLYVIDKLIDEQDHSPRRGGGPFDAIC